MKKCCHKCGRQVYVERSPRVLIYGCKPCNWSVEWDLDALRREMERHPDTIIIDGEELIP